MGRDPADADGARMGNFNSSSHNFLRISRILTSLGELGFRRCKALPASRVDPVSLRYHSSYYGTNLL